MGKWKDMTKAVLKLHNKYNVNKGPFISKSDKKDVIKFQSL